MIWSWLKKKKKQRHYFANKCPFNQSYGFSSGHVWMWELDCEESRVLRIDAFELWCWRRLLRVPWTTRRSNQSFLKEVSPEYSLEGLTKLKLQCFATWWEELTHWKRRPWYWERLKAGGGGGDRGWDGWMASPTPWTWVWVNSGSWWWTGRACMLQSMRLQSRTYSNWTELNWFWERLKAGGEGDDRGWDSWMASSTWWTWVSVNSGSWWWTGRPGIL